MTTFAFYRGLFATIALLIATTVTCSVFQFHDLLSILSASTVQLQKSLSVSATGGRRETSNLSSNAEPYPRPPLLASADSKREQEWNNESPSTLTTDLQRVDEEFKRLSPIALPKKAYTFDPNDDDLYTSNISSLKIRSWGCERRHEAPLIFVHIGKSGGGSIRARLAASALDYNRDRWHDTNNDPSYYYPIMDKSNGVMHKGIFVNSQFPNFRPSYPKTADNFTVDDMNYADNERWKTYEKTLPCQATTPLGQAVACPAIAKKKEMSACVNHRCDIVYAGHNLLGNEMHWLPTKFLEDWWKSTPWSLTRTTDLMQHHWQERSSRWNKTLPEDWSLEAACYAYTRNPLTYYRSRYFDCVAPHEDDADAAATAMVDASIRDNHDWSQLYASLPILRVTMMREPFSWLVSKFFWHKAGSGRLIGRNGTYVPLHSCDNNFTDFESISNWAGPALMKQINHICGEDCLVRMHKGIITLDQAERQARHNLQHSFAVVGLLNETDTFFDMITARVGYMNTSLNQDVKGGKHSTSKLEEYKRCSEVYKQPNFQAKLLEAIPELAALLRLYQVGLLVNRHQIQEMQTCGLL